MAQLSKSALTSENNNSFPNNNTGYITPELLRTFNQDMIDSTVNQTVYTADSASWNSQIAALDPSGSAESVVLLNAFTASQEIKNTTLASVTASLQQQLTNIGTQSGSWVTESETASFARTNVTNTFTQPQIISAAVTASSARISNLNYPTTDNGAKSFIQTDGAGNLSLQYVDAILEEVRYGENITIGDPLYVSGSNGTRPVVWKADAAIASKMPVIYIASSTNVANTNTTAITLGLITGVTTTGYPTGTEIYVAEGGGWSANRPSGSSSIVQPLGIVTKEGPGGSGRGLVLNPGPATLPNIQTGYVWVGNGNNQPLAVATSSLVTSPTDITALNAFTASQNTKNSTLETYTASVNTQLTNLSTSQSIDNQKWINISAQSGSWGVASGSVPGGTVSSSAQIVELGFLQTSSFQAYTSSQDTKNITLASVTASLQQQLTNIGSQSGSWITESETGSFIVTASINLNTITFTKGNATTFNITVNTGSGTSTDLTSLNAFTASQYISNSFFATTGSNTFNGNQIVNGDLTATGYISASYLQGPNGVFTTLTATTINAGNGIVSSSAQVVGILSSLNTYTASQNTINTNVGLSASLYETKFATIGTQSGSWITESETGSFATTGSNTFTGTQTITGSSPLLEVFATDGSETRLSKSGLSIQTVNTLNTPTLIASYAPTSSDSSMVLGVYDNPNFNVDVEYQTKVSPSGIQFQDWDNGSSFDYVNWMTIAPNTGNNPAPVMTRGLVVTGSTNIQNLTASLQQGYVWVGDASGKTTTVATSSFGGGGAAFPYTGTASISGSLQVTGSMSGLPNELTVATNTASIDFTKGNFFSITLPASATTHFTVANTIKGQTINIQINQPVGASTGSVAFAPSILFAGGNDYQATATGSAIDLLTLVAITGSSVLATSIKNFL